MLAFESASQARIALKGFLSEMIPSVARGSAAERLLESATDELFAQRRRRRGGGGGGGGGAARHSTTAELDSVDLSTPTALEELLAGLRGIVEARAVVAEAGDLAPPDFFAILRDAEHAVEWRSASRPSAPAIATRPPALVHRLIRICEAAAPLEELERRGPAHRAPSKRAKAARERKEQLL
jgi:hypothetical protein